MKKQLFTTLCSAVLALGMASNVLADKDKHTEYAHGYGKFEFALIGDVPYGVDPGVESMPFDNLVEDVNSNHKIKWVLHAGDIKSGGSQCSDELFYDRLHRFSQFNAPVILTPGDNEWTDCHRVAAGQYQPLERLEKLREVFFPVPGQTSIGGRSMQLESQASVPGFEEFPENVMWTRQNITFAAFHIIGSHNGLNDFDPNSSAVRTQADDDEVARRIQAALTWMDTVFARAEALDSPGVFLMIHANPGLERSSSGLNRTGFVEYLTALENHVRHYNRPVVLAHGDSHYMRVDKPALVNSTFLPNFTRVETFGSSHVNWLRVVVDPKSEEVFSVHQQIVE